MRVMQLTIDCPWPAISGADIRNGLLSEAAAVSAFQCVGLTAPAPAEGPPPAAYRHVAVCGDRNPWRCIDPTTPTCLMFSGAAMSAIETLVDEFAPDVVVAEGVAWRDVVERLSGRGISVVLDMHNVESQLFAQRLAARPLWRRLAEWHRARGWVSAAKQADRGVSSRADSTWVCSEDDAALLEGLGGRAYHVIRNPIPDGSLLELPLAVDRYRSPTPLFIGHLAYFPNVAAVEELAGAYAAAARREGIDVRPVVAGRSPGRRIKTLATANAIRLVVDPPSTAALARAHGYTVLPIRHGGGTRIKVIEALAAGVVVIATRKAVEGLGLTPGRHFIAAETPEAMAVSMRHLTLQPDEAVAIAACGRQFVMERHERGRVLAAIDVALNGMTR